MTSPIQPIRVESILVDGRLRKLREDVVAELAESIRDVGLIHPLLIRRPGGHLVPHLVAGWHRLEAVKQLGWELVPCCTLDGDDVLAELNEIDENLARADLTPAERAAHTGRRKELYEQLHPETRNGAIGGGHTQLRQPGEAAPAMKRYTATTKRSERTAQREAARAKRVPRITDAIGTSLDQGEELDALGKLPAEQQDELLDRAMAGEAVSAKELAAVTTWDEEEEWHADEFLRIRQDMLSAWKHWVQCDPGRSLPMCATESGVTRCILRCRPMRRMATGARMPTSAAQ